MENLVKNLTQKRKEIISGGLDHAKYVEIAKRAGCPVEVVRAYARLAYAERRMQQEAKWAEAQAATKGRHAVFVAEAEKLLEAGNKDAVRVLWYGSEFGGQATIEEVYDANTDLYDEIANDIVEDYRESTECEDEVRGRMEVLLKDETDEALENGFDAFIEVLKA